LLLWCSLRLSILHVGRKTCLKTFTEGQASVPEAVDAFFERGLDVGGLRAGEHQAREVQWKEENCAQRAEPEAPVEKVTLTYVFNLSDTDKFIVKYNVSQYKAKLIKILLF
jgi:hypothetical protein